MLITSSLFLLENIINVLSNYSWELIRVCQHQFLNDPAIDYIFYHLRSYPCVLIYLQKWNKLIQMSSWDKFFHKDSRRSIHSSSCSGFLSMNKKNTLMWHHSVVCDCCTSQLISQLPLILVILSFSKIKVTLDSELIPVWASIIFINYLTEYKCD